MKFEKLKPGTVAYTVSSHRAGNTTLRTVSVHPVEVREVDTERRRVLASWNCNPAKWFSERETAKWREKKPMTVETFFGCCRLATREEIAAAKAGTGEAG